MSANPPAKLRKEGLKAWLVTWEYQGWEQLSTRRHRGPSRVAAVLDQRWGGERVGEVVRVLYANEFFGPKEQLDAARSKAAQPPLDLGRLEGSPWCGRIRCGGTPYLYARLVDNLKVAGASGPLDEFTWDEIPSPAPRGRGRK